MRLLYGWKNCIGISHTGLHHRSKAVLVLDEDRAFAGNLSPDRAEGLSHDQSDQSTCPGDRSDHSDRQVIILFCFLFQVAGQQEGEQQAEYRNYN